MRTKIAPSAERRSKLGEPSWEIAYLFPRQGQWTETEYLSLKTKCLVEFSKGIIEVLPLPTFLHQVIARFLYLALDSLVTARSLGKALFAPLPVRLWSAKYREPDIIFLKPHRYQGKVDYPKGADLVMEVVSEGEESRRRDMEIKPQEYAAAGILEYWIVDPERWQITVMKLVRKRYKVHGVFGAGTSATSVLLPGFAVNVNEVFQQ